MAKTNFQDVYIDEKGQYYYEVSLGTDNITGKRIKKKLEKMLMERNFHRQKKHIQKLSGLKMITYNHMDIQIMI